MLSRGASHGHDGVQRSRVVARLSTAQSMSRHRCGSPAEFGRLVVSR